MVARGNGTQHRDAIRDRERCWRRCVDAHAFESLDVECVQGFLHDWRILRQWNVSKISVFSSRTCRAAWYRTAGTVRSHSRRYPSLAQPAPLRVNEVEPEISRFTHPGHPLRLHSVRGGSEIFWSTSYVVLHSVHSYSYTGMLGSITTATLDASSKVLDAQGKYANICE